MRRSPLPRSAIVLITLLAALVLPALVHADAAPPPFPPGSNLSTGGYDTQVEMLFEDVTITIQQFEGEAVYLANPELQDYSDGPDLLLNAGEWGAHVQARFVMINTGNADEAFDVWFPLVGPDQYTYSQISNFHAWVDGNLAPVSAEKTPDQPMGISDWASWPARFPVNQEVELYVEYDVKPSTNFPHFTVAYVLETGAGWKGVIGDGVFTFILPYEVEGFVRFYAGSYEGSLPRREGDVIREGNRITWRFYDLEPPPGAAVGIGFWDPDVQPLVVVAREEAASQPGSAEAHYRLGQALENMIGMKYNIVSGFTEAEEAQAAYERAIEIDPENLTYHYAYIRLLLMYQSPVVPPPPEFYPAMEQALAINATDPGLQELLQIYHNTASFRPDLYTDAPAVPTPGIPRPTRTPGPEGTSTPRPASPTPDEPTATAPSTPTPTPAPTGGCASGWLLIGLALVISGQQIRRKIQGA